MPKVGAEVGTPDGTGTVVNVNMLKMEVKVRIDMGDGAAYKDFPVDSLNSSAATTKRTRTKTRTPRK